MYSIYLLYGNAALLVCAVIIKLTGDEREGVEREEVEGEGLEREGLEREGLEIEGLK
jgi:hypothetical protein